MFAIYFVSLQFITVYKIISWTHNPCIFDLQMRFCLKGKILYFGAPSALVSLCWSQMGEYKSKGRYMRIVDGLKKILYKSDSSLWQFSLRILEGIWQMEKKQKKAIKNKQNQVQISVI